MVKSEPAPITEEDGPFSYSYIAVMGVPGIRLDDADDDLHLFSFPELNATAVLTKDWDQHCQHIDRSSAIALLLLTAFRGRTRFKRISVWTNRLFRKLFGATFLFKRNLAREERNAQIARHKEHTSPGCYLVYRANGALLEPARLQSARKIDRIGFGFDVINGEPYRSIHSAALHAVATSISLLIDQGTGSPEINEIGDIILLQGSRDLILYPRRIEMGAVGVVTSASPNANALSELRQYVPLIAADRRIETAVSLFVQSHRRDGDNLRAFIPAWSALELLVNRLARIVRKDWEKLLQEANLPDWDKNLSGVSPEKYRMRDRFFSVACTLNLEGANDDCVKFNKSNDLRSGYYHRNEVRERDLPTNEIRSLFRKYLALAILYQRPTTGQDQAQPAADPPLSA